MNKERLGNFISGERRNLGLTQRDLAAALHVTDKAVSKWERGLSYPDVTLLEPLAAALDLGVEELMACRRQASRGGEGADETSDGTFWPSPGTACGGSGGGPGGGWRRCWRCWR